MKAEEVDSIIESIGIKIYKPTAQDFIEGDNNNGEPI